VALTISQGEDGFYVEGASGSPAAPVYLGQDNFPLTDSAGGRHTVGFDRRFREPVIMRAFFEPSPEQVSNWDTIGYVQYVSYHWSTDSQPLWPDDAFGPMASGWFTKDDPGARSKDDAHKRRWFVDFMSPWAVRAARGARDAYDRPVVQDLPYYACNGWLMPEFESVYDSSGPAGSVYASKPPIGARQPAACASITAGVTFSLLDEGAVASFLSDDNRLCTVNAQDGTPAYQVALTALRTPQADGLPAPLAGLEDTDVDAISVGGYVLLTPAPADAMPDTICITPANADGQSDVHLLTVYDMDEMQYGLGSDLLWDIRRYVAVTGKRDLSPKGLRGLGSDGQSNPLAAEAATRGLQVTYHTAAVGSRQGGGRRAPILSAFEWSATLLFDPFSGRFNLSGSTEPRLAVADVMTADSAFRNVLSQHGNSTVSKAPDDSRFRSLSIQRQLFGPGPGAPPSDGGSSPVSS
jgi:hypothetical protein